MNVVYLIRHSWTNENKIHLIQGRSDYKLCEEGGNHECFRHGSRTYKD